MRGDVVNFSEIQSLRLADEALSGMILIARGGRYQVEESDNDLHLRLLRKGIN